MPQAVQIGAGKIGRGFLAQLFQQGGYDTTFVDIDTALVERLNARRSYPLRLLTGDATEAFTVQNFRALPAHDTAAVTDALRHADLISVSVGVANLPDAARTLTDGINARATSHRAPVDIFICENQWHAAPILRTYIAPHIAPHAQAYFDTHTGLVEAVIGRTVPAPSAALLAEDPLLLVAEAVVEIPVARDMMRGPVPNLPGLLLAPDIEAYEARKLYLHNMAHAALAYLGQSRRIEYIWQCTERADVAQVCRGAMYESSASLAAEYGFTLDELHRYCDNLMARFANPALGDTTARVAADPIRKLRPTDRLIGAANLCLKHDISPVYISHAIASAVTSATASILRENDPRYIELRSQIAVKYRRDQPSQMWARTLQTLSNVPEGSPLSTQILSNYRVIEFPNTSEWKEESLGKS